MRFSNGWLRRASRPDARSPQGGHLCAGEPPRRRVCPLCARSRRRQTSNPTPSCGWRGRSALKATRISARPFRDAITARCCRLPRPRALAAGNPQVGRPWRALRRYAASDALRNIEETFAAYLNRRPESRSRGDLGCAAGLSRWGSASTTLSRGISPTLPRRG